MLRAGSIRIWTWLHKWSSLVCTLFMLLLCLTGLPLIFHEELAPHKVDVPPLLNDAQRAPLDEVLAAARALYPDRIVQYASLDEEDPRIWSVTLTPSPLPTFDFKSVQVDARTAKVLTEAKVGEGFMDLMLRLHTDLFAGQPGKLFLGFMGLLLLVSLVSGVVLYAPFMRKLDFGTVRHERANRTRWLDLHNLLGIATLVWVLVVGATGVVNTLAEIVTSHWQNDQLAALTRPYVGQPTLQESDRAPVQATYAAAQVRAPGMHLAFMAFPGTAFSSPHHNTFFLRGNTPLTHKLLQPVLVDARTAEVTAAPELPWYLSALLLSQPLHFGDYAGMAMKIIWALLDIVTIIVLGSGLYLWLKRH